MDFPLKKFESGEDAYTFAYCVRIKQMSNEEIYIGIEIFFQFWNKILLHTYLADFFIFKSSAQHV